MKNSNLAFAALLIQFVDNKDISNSAMTKAFIENNGGIDAAEESAPFDKREHEVTSEISEFAAAFIANTRLKRTDKVSRLFNEIIEKGKALPRIEDVVQPVKTVNRSGEY